MSTRKIVEDYQNEFISKAKLYNDLQKEFDEHRGKELTEANRHVVETVFESIQNVFEELQPFFLFIINNYTMAKMGLNGHNEFLDTLVRSGIIAKKEENH